MPYFQFKLFFRPNAKLPTSLQCTILFDKTCAIIPERHKHLEIETGQELLPKQAHRIIIVKRHVPARIKKQSVNQKGSLWLPQQRIGSIWNGSGEESIGKFVSYCQTLISHNARRHIMTADESFEGKRLNTYEDCPVSGMMLQLPNYITRR